MVKEFQINTPTEGFIEITQKIIEIVASLGISDGVCQVFVPHTTAGITMNENADPDVVRDMIAGLNNIVPNLAFRHNEGNSRAHIKASLIGASVSIPVVDGSLYLGTWQGVYFCEFDGPRKRTVTVNCVGS